MRGRRQIARAERELFRLCVVDGELDDERAREVARQLGASKRRGSLAVLASFMRLVRLEEARHTARIESALPLDTGLRDVVQRRLMKAYGDRLKTSFEQNPALIGGLRIRVGSDVYDGSVRARLAALMAAL